MPAAKNKKTLRARLLEFKRGFFSLEVPLWVALICLVGLSAIVTVGYNYFNDRFHYTLNLPASNQKPIALSYGAIPALANPDYFNKVKNSFIEQKTSFILADLSAMKLTMYKDGVVDREMPILTKGKEGSWWETPAGIYKIETKEPTHFSSIGKVYQPWSMEFQGNFFIHGWPYEPDGTPVATTYSGGCIRLSTDDAKIVYDNVSLGTPILVYEKDFGVDDFKYAAKEPAVTATSYLVADLKNDFALAGKNTLATLPLGGTTKLVSALVAAEYINLDKTTSYNSNTVSIYDLMFPVLMESDDDATHAVAKQLGSGRFVTLMNDKATALGMTASHFNDPTGTDDTSLSTAEDLFALSKYLYNNRSFILKMSAGQISSSVYGEPFFKNIRSQNIPTGLENNFIGGMIDTTSSSQTFVGTFEITVQNQPRQIAIIVLGSTDAKKDVATLFEYAQSQYQ